MQYLVADRAAIGSAAIDPRQVIAKGEMMVLEGPWPWGAPIVACLDSAADIRVKAAGVDAYAVEALDDPGGGEAFVVAAHRIRDTWGFRPYVEQVTDIVARFGGRFLARGGKVTLFGGNFVPDRAVIIEFPTAADAVAFYLSDIYAPLLKIRHVTTDPRFVVMARAGVLPAAVRARAEDYLRSRVCPSH